MKNKTYLAGLAFSSMMIGMSGAVVISGVTFTDGPGVGGLDGNTGGGNTNPSTFVSSVVSNSPSSATINGVFNQNSYIGAGITVGVGDTIEFDLSYSALTTQGTDNYSGGRYFSLLNGADAQLIGSGTNQSQDMNIDGSWTGTNLGGNAVFHVTLAFTATNVNWTIAGTSDGSPSTSSQTGTKVIDPTAISGLRFGVNDTRTAMTISNISGVTPVPEPSAVLLGGLGLLGLLRRRRA